MHKIYYGNASAKPKEIKGMFIGSGNEERLVKKVYYGVNGVPKLCYEDSGKYAKINYDFTFAQGVTNVSSLPRYAYTGDSKFTIDIKFDDTIVTAIATIYTMGTGVTFTQEFNNSTLTIEFVFGTLDSINIKIFSGNEYSIPSGCYLISATESGAYAQLKDLCSASEVLINEEPLNGCTVYFGVPATIDDTNEQIYYTNAVIDAITIDDRGITYHFDSAHPNNQYINSLIEAYEVTFGFRFSVSQYENENFAEFAWGIFDSDGYIVKQVNDLAAITFEEASSTSSVDLYELLFNNKISGFGAHRAIHWGLYRFNSFYMSPELPVAIPDLAHEAALNYQVYSDMNTDVPYPRYEHMLAAYMQNGYNYYIAADYNEYKIMTDNYGDETPSVDNILIPYTQLINEYNEAFIANLSKDNYLTITSGSIDSDNFIIKKATSCTFEGLLRITFDLNYVVEIPFDSNSWTDIMESGGMHLSCSSFTITNSIKVEVLDKQSPDHYNNDVTYCYEFVNGSENEFLGYPDGSHIEEYQYRTSTFIPLVDNYSGELVLWVF